MKTCAEPWRPCLLVMKEITNVRSFTERDYIEAMPVVYYSSHCVVTDVYLLKKSAVVTETEGCRKFI